MHQSASTVVSALYARSAVGVQYVSTVVSALGARSAVGQESASMVVCALNARNAVGLHSVSTVVSATHAKSAVVHQSASTIVGVIDARSVAPQRLLERIHSSARTTNTVQRIFLQLPLYRTLTPPSAAAARAPAYPACPNPGRVRTDRPRRSHRRLPQ